MKDVIKRTSEEWQKLKLKPKIQVLGPDGWDRQNFEHSWHQERITEAEYDRRIMMSTVQMAPIFLDETQTIADKKFSEFNDELIDRYFNGAGKDAIEEHVDIRVAKAKQDGAEEFSVWVKDNLGTNFQDELTLGHISRWDVDHLLKRFIDAEDKKQ